MIKSSHYNAFIRKDAILALKELQDKFPELILQNTQVILNIYVKGIIDDEEIVREAMEEGWKGFLNITPLCQLAPFVQTVRIYCCSALTHVSAGIRRDALTFIQHTVAFSSELLLMECETSKEEIGRLLENFGDCIDAKTNIQLGVQNTYNKTSKKKPTDALARRGIAVSVLFQLLQAAFTPETNCGKNRIKKRERSVDVMEYRGLLLFPSVSEKTTQAVGQSLIGDPVWEKQVTKLLLPLLEFWLEASATLQEGASGSVSVSQLTHAVQCLSLFAQTCPVIVKTVLRGRVISEMVDSFPMSPVRMELSDYNARNGWVDLNVALGDLALSYASSSSSKQAKKKTTTFPPLLQDFLAHAFQNAVDCPTFRTSANSTSTLERMLALLQRLLFSTSSWEECSEVLGAFDAYHAVCGPNSRSKSLCSHFLSSTLLQLCAAHPGRRLDTTTVVGKTCRQWMITLASDWSECNDDTLSAIRASIDPVRLLLLRFTDDSISGPAADALTAIFACHTSLYTLSLQEQKGIVSILLHIPTLPSPLLKSLSKIVLDPKMSICIREMIMDIVYHWRTRNADASSLLSFFCTVLFQNGESEASLDEEKVITSVCRYLRQNPSYLQAILPLWTQSSLSQNTSSPRSMLALFNVLREIHASSIENSIHSSVLITGVLMQWETVGEPIQRALMNCIRVSPVVLLPVFQTLLTQSISEIQAVSSLLSVLELSSAFRECKAFVNGFSTLLTSCKEVVRPENASALEEVETKFIVVCRCDE